VTYIRKYQICTERMHLTQFDIYYNISQRHANITFPKAISYKHISNVNKCKMIFPSLAHKICSTCVWFPWVSRMLQLWKY